MDATQRRSRQHQAKAGVKQPMNRPKAQRSEIYSRNPLSLGKPPVRWLAGPAGQ
jgi:hypothetical protein